MYRFVSKMKHCEKQLARYLGCSYDNRFFLSSLVIRQITYVGILEQTIITMTIALIVFQVVGLYLLLDFLTGVVHFWMDRYGREDMPLVGKAIIEINTWHHENPRRMTTRSYWYLCKSGWVGVGAMLVGVYLVTGTVSWQWWFIGILGANANIVHQWAHKFPNEKPALINWLQKIGVIQRPHDHAQHHTKPETRSYCTYTPWLNPILDRIGFWFGIERFFATFGVYTTDRID